MQTKTGLATIDQPWMQHYNVENPVISPEIIKNKTIWDVVEESFDKEKEIPAIEYFGRIISRQEFKDYVITWAKGLKALGVKEGDFISLYVPASPESLALLLASNAIGAIPYYQKLAITKEALQEETKESRVAVVFDVMWENVKDVFLEERFEHIIVTSATDSMKFPVKQITNIKNVFGGAKSTIPNDARIVRTKEVLGLAENYNIDYKVPFSPDRIAVITTSSGTTSNEVKGTMDTNEGALASLAAWINSGIVQKRGKRTLVCFPPTASTSINCLQLTTLVTDGTIIFDPRVDMSLWHEQIMKYKPDFTISTGPVWELFARNIDKMNKEGKMFDLSWADGFLVGGAGTTPGILKYINTVLRKNGLKYDLYSGYGYSEVFGPISCAKRDMDNSSDLPVLSIGLPMPGYEVGIFDEEGNELPYGKGHRGELWSRCPANMHGYYGKPDKTAELIIDGWIHSGDLCEISENGSLFCYGRLKHSIDIDGDRVYLFDISIDVREKFGLHDVFTEDKKLIDGTDAINMYFVQEESGRKDNKTIIKEIDEYLASKNINIHAYREYDEMLPIEPTTLKIKTKVMEGFVRYVGEERINVSYEEVEKDVYVERVNASRTNTK